MWCPRQSLENHVRLRSGHVLRSRPRLDYDSRRIRVAGGWARNNCVKLVIGVVPECKRTCKRYNKN